jgi:soluble lytic murein transglycosylase-like protein
MIRLALLLAACAALHGADEIVLRTGFRLTADRHEISGEMLRLYTASGTMEIPRTAVEEILHLEPAPLSAPPATAPPTELKPAPAPKSTQEILRETASNHGLPAEILLSIAKIESAFQVNALSPKGAMGVMQLMPETARALQVDPKDPQQNIEGGARLMRDLLLKYQNYPDQVYRALSAYNAGEGAVARYNGVPPYRETQDYVQKVLNEYHRLKAAK